MTKSFSAKPPSDPTIFDQILADQIPATKVYEDEYVLAFEDIHPAAQVHVLVIPKQKMISCADFIDADPSILGQYMKRVADVAQKLGLNSSGYRIVFNHGADGGQTVDYVHAHILGGQALGWPPG